MSDKVKPNGGPVRALVLSGGGARGAYEAGVLAYFLQELPAALWERASLRVICGTSVGAVHACFLAGAADRPHHDISRVLAVWRSFKIEQMLRLGLRDLVRMPTELYMLSRRGQPPSSGVLLNSHVLQEIVVRQVPWHGIRRNLHAGRIEALTVSATHITSGKTVVFVDRHGGEVPPWTRDRRREARGVRIKPAHALASAAIPFLFPAIAIDGAYYCDGGLRLNTPLAPALRLGADRVLVIGLRSDNPAAVPLRPESGLEPYPRPFYMIGKLLDALMLDRLDYDLKQLNGFNEIIRNGRAVFGPDFLERLNEIVVKVRGMGYRDVQTLFIRPSRDIGAMATEFAQINHPTLGGVPGWLLSRLGSSSAVVDSDLMSYIMFDGRFSEVLIQLGMADADAHRSQLIDFLKE